MVTTSSFELKTFHIFTKIAVQDFTKLPLFKHLFDQCFGLLLQVTTEYVLSQYVFNCDLQLNTYWVNTIDIFILLLIYTCTHPAINDGHFHNAIWYMQASNQKLGPQSTSLTFYKLLGTTHFLSLVEIVRCRLYIII